MQRQAKRGKESLPNGRQKRQLHSDGKLSFPVAARGLWHTEQLHNHNWISQKKFYHTQMLAHRQSD